MVYYLFTILYTYSADTAFKPFWRQLNFEKRSIDDFR